MKFDYAAKKLQDGIEETLTYMDFPTQHWTRIRTNNTIELLNREIKRRTKVIGAFSDSDACMCQTAACSGNSMGTQGYMNMNHLTRLEDNLPSESIVG